MEILEHVPHFVTTTAYILRRPLEFHLEVIENEDALFLSTFKDALDFLVNILYKGYAMIVVLSIKWRSRATALASSTSHTLVARHSMSAQWMVSDSSLLSLPTVGCGRVSACRLQIGYLLKQAYPEMGRLLHLLLDYD